MVNIDGELVSLKMLTKLKLLFNDDFDFDSVKNN